MTRRRAYTLLEMLVVIAVIGTIAILAAPMLRDDGRLRLLAAAEIVTSDLQLAQIMTVAYPDDPVVVRFDDAGDRYWLAYADAPETPLPREGDGEPYLVVLGTGRASAAAGVVFRTVDMLGASLTWNAQGGLEDFLSTPMVELTAGPERFVTLAVAPTTGRITQIDGPAPEEEPEPEPEKEEEVLPPSK